MAEVTGSVVATRKHKSLVGSKLLLIRDLSTQNGSKSNLVAVDAVGAGKGDLVLVATGSAARLGIQDMEAPVDLAIVGIIDQLEGYPK